MPSTAQLITLLIFSMSKFASVSIFNLLNVQASTNSVTTRFMMDNLFTTSYEKVAILEETSNSFIMCMTSCSENIINGYYRIKIYFDENTKSITINYAKVQTIEPIILTTLIDNKITGNKKYTDANINSVKNTINFLSGKDDFKIENVIYEYK